MSDSEEDYSSDEVPELDEADQIDDADLITDADDDISDDEDDELNIIGSLHKGDSNHTNIIIVPDSERITSDVIQKQEIVEAIGVRASQIEEGSPVFTDVTGLTDPISMSWKEFKDRKSPLILERIVAEYPAEFTYHVEHWKVREMALPYTYE